MAGILRLSHAEVRVPDLELSLAYYVEVVGLVEVERTADRVYLKGWDEHQHHSLILATAPTYGLDSIGFKVQDVSDLDDLAAVGSKHPVSRRPATRRVSSLRVRATSSASGHRAGTRSTSSTASCRSATAFRNSTRRWAPTR